MRLKTPLRRLLTLSAIGLATGTLLVGAGTANASSTHGHSSRVDCLQLDVVDRTVEAYVPSQAPPASVLGIGTYFDVINESTDTTAIGTATGLATVLYQRSSDSHLMEYLAQQWQLPEGTIAYQGTFDRTSMLAGELVRGPAQGISGRYEGMVGWLQWQLIGYGIGNHKVLEHFVLCGRGAAA